MPQFTKAAIINTFIDLLNKYPLNKITVKDIVDSCGINRSTFYYYFQDIYTLLVEMFDSETSKVLMDNDELISWNDAFLHSMAFARQNKKAIYHIYNSLNRKYLDKYLYSVIEHYLNLYLHAVTKDYNVKEDDIALVTEVYKFSLVGMIYSWLEHGMDKEFDEISTHMYELLGDNLKYDLIRTDPDYCVTTTVSRKSDI